MQHCSYQSTRQFSFGPRVLILDPVCKSDIGYSIL